MLVLESVSVNKALDLTDDCTLLVADWHEENVKQLQSEWTTHSVRYLLLFQNGSISCRFVA